MAREACKVIINMGVQALTQAIERILIDKDIYTGRLPEDVRLFLIQRLADLDLAVYEGNTALMAEGGLTGILGELEKHGLVTDEVRAIYHKPFITADKKANKEHKPHE